jgi:hypothetical protein
MNQHAKAAVLLDDPNSAHAHAETVKPKATTRRAPNRSTAMPLGSCPTA